MPKYTANVKFDSGERVITADTPTDDVLDMVCSDDACEISGIEREYDTEELSEKLEDGHIEGGEELVPRREEPDGGGGEES